MKKGLLFVFLFIGVHVIAQQINRTVAVCSFTPAFTYSPSTPCANSSITFTNATSNGNQSLGSSATTTNYSLSGFSLTANSGQSLIIRMLIYGTGTSTRFLQVKSFVANGSTSAGATISTWALTANSTGVNTGAGAASIIVGNETIGSGVTNGGYSSNGHQLQTASGWPAAATNTVYEQFSVTPNLSYNLSVTSLSFTTRITGGSGSLNLILQYSTDGGTSFSAIPFTGSGAPSGMTYDWDFGDATAHSGSTNPTHTYTLGGSYSITLSAFDGSCTSTTTKTVSVTGNVVYVNAAAVGSNNGSSWANAFTTLQAGIDAAAACGTPVQVWVAANTYKPNSYPWAAAGGSARDYAFALKNNVAVYGGFVGTETLLSQRNYTTNVTILSGDIGTAGVNTDNCHHVVVGSGINSTAVLDGFTITSGYANGSSNITTNGNSVERNDGAAMINRSASPTLNNCIFTNNTATDEGGAMYNYASSPTISNCTFSSNTAPDGGAINNYSSSAPSINNSAFSSNTATSIGGAIRNDGCSPTIGNSTFTSNSTSSDGGAIYNESSAAPSITGCTFTSNTSPSEGGAIYNKNASLTITSCIFLNNTATTSGGDGGAIFNNSSTATISSCSFTGNTAGNDGGAIRSSSSSITVTNCSFTSNSAVNGGAMQHSGSATITISNSTFTSNTATSRAGAIYNNGSTPTITSCTFTSNYCNNDGGAMYNNNSTTITVTKCIFSANTSNDTGGGVANQSGSTNTYTNCIFAGNTSDVGGGVYNNSTTTTMTNCTVYNNVAYGVISSPNGGGGIRNSGGSLNIKNCIIWGNTSPVGPSIYSTSTTTVTYSAVEGGYTGTGNISTDPIFVNPSTPKGTDNTWATADDGLMIHCTSPAKNTGTATGAPATDIVGSTRSTVDMGAYEQVLSAIVPSASIAITTGAQTICAGTSVTFTATPTNCGISPTYQWQVNGSNVGTNAVTYTSTALVNGDVVKCIITPGLDVCPTTATATSNTVTMTVTTPPSATISYTTPSCSNGGTATVSLTGTTGGIFSSTTGLVIDATTGAINLSSSTAAGYTVTYTVAAAGGCALFSTTAPVTINTAPSASISYAGTPYCSNAGTATVSLTGTAGGTFSSTTGLVINATTGAINLSSSTAGTYIVTYTIVANAGCSIYTTTTSVTITTAPSASISYAGTLYCSNASTASVSLTGTTGGTYSSTTGLVINATTGVINLSLSTAGTYVVTYTVVAANGCSIYTTTTSVTITAAPLANISYAGSPYCSNASTATVSLTGTTGGSFSSTTGLVIDGTTGSINLSSSTAGTYIVTYTIAANAGCSIYTTTTSVTITTAPSASISYSGSPYCSNAGTATVSLTGTTGGTFSSTAGLVINATTGAINVSSSTAGTYIVTYAVAAANGCSLFSTTTAVTITSMPSASITYSASPFCSNAGTATVSLTGTTGGTFSSTSGLVINATTGAINLSSSTAGSYIVTYTIAANAGCAIYTTTTSVTITAIPSASISYSGSPYCSNAGTAIVSLTGTTGGTFSSTSGLVINATTGAINLSSSTAGTYLVSYTIAANAGCSIYTTTTSVTITTAPSASISYSGSPYCSNAGTATVSLTGTTGGTFSSTAGLVVNATTGAINVSSSTAGTYIVTYAVAAANGCSLFLTTTAVTITSMPSASITYSASPFCSNAGTATVSLTGTTGGIFSSTSGLAINTTTGAINLSSSTAGTYTVTYTVAAANGCAVYTTTSAITITTTVLPSISIAASATNICAGTSITFTATSTNGGTVPSYQWKINGVNAGTNSSTFISSTISNGDVITCVLTSNATCVTSATATSNSIPMVVNPNLTPTIVIAASANTICAGTSVTFTATPTNGGSLPSYQWKVNGVNAGINSSTFTSTTLNNTDVVTCVLTSNVSCVTSPTATSNGVTMIVNTNLTPSIIIVASSNNICAGTSIVFTATPTNGGLSPSYQWQVNGINAGTNSSSFSSSTLTNGNTVTCAITSNATCLTTVTATSNVVSIAVTPNVTPAISIAASQTTICSGTSITFTATATNGGSLPSYQWLVNGIQAGANSSTFSSATLSNGNIVSCILTSNATCVTSATATSNNITMVVNPILTPSITITPSTNNVCAGTSVTFTATPTNAGTIPTYQWKINGTNVGTNSPTFTLSTLNNNDIITCVLTSNATCLSTPSATSNNITMIVNANVTPAISIASSANNICAGTSVTFTATPTNGGASPTYQWKANGVNVGTNASTFTSTTLNNGDVITCVLTSNATCLAAPSSTSSGITMIVNPNLTPIISIVASTNNVCLGTSITFTATQTNGGTTPSYQWKVNGTNVGTNNTTFTSTTLNNNDVVTCVLTSNATCLAMPTATSNSITISASTPVTPTISIAVSANNICSGTSVTFTATPTNEGTMPTYQWKVNGVNVGTNASTFTSSTLSNNDVVVCVLTTSAACTTSTTVTSNSITMIVTIAVTPTISIVSSLSEICAGTNVAFTATSTNGGTTPIYQWQINGSNAGTNSTTFTTNSLALNDVVTCSLTSSITCVTAATVVSNQSLVNVHPLPTVFAGPDKVIFAGGFTQLFATAFGNIDTIKWTPATSLSYDTILQPIAKPIATTLYRLRVVTTDGCSATDDVEIKVVDGVFVPNAFSPNGDNINDKWEIPALADFPESIVQVFNRAGQLVFKATSYTSTKYWDGTRNGSPLPVGVYYYIIDLKNGNKPMSGYVTILK